MQSKYYYLISSLPLLQFAAKPEIEIKKFLSECEKWVGPLELWALRRASIDSSTIPCQRNQTLMRWREADSCLRDDLSKAREITQNSQGEKLPASMASVFAQATPLLMEKEFARKQWIMLDELESGHYFDTDMLIVYFLKLQILERFAAFNKDEGMQVFKSVCEVAYD